MSTMTYYQLSIYGDRQKIEEAEADAEANFSGYISDLVINGELQAYKWYDFSSDFQKFARLHPDVLFVISGDDGELMDTWEERFKGEEHEAHEVEMPPFTNPKLKIPLE